ncbi:hypothetical protein ABID26_006512 [Mesorhizobium shonense]|uniref:Uncharacterized protein n=1 Tax=Mesorhizobium shonense TaxID=1209948 RepID=A0ABV2I2K2_9HYPH
MRRRDQCAFRTRCDKLIDIDSLLIDWDGHSLEPRFVEGDPIAVTWILDGDPAKPDGSHYNAG